MAQQTEHRGPELPDESPELPNGKVEILEVVDWSGAGSDTR